MATKDDLKSQRASSRVCVTPDKKMWDMRKVLLMMGAEFVMPASDDHPEQRIAVADGRATRVS